MLGHSLDLYDPYQVTFGDFGKKARGECRPLRCALIFDVMFERFRPAHGKLHYR
jgi:hypothetical protein